MQNRAGQPSTVDLPSLYIMETVPFCRSKCTQIRGHDVHGYETRGRDNYRSRRHRTVVFYSFFKPQLLAMLACITGAVIPPNIWPHKQVIIFSADSQLPHA
ncbi:hypothetical protein J6590_030435 [Homalodisca vitripennis]|nr:hypothetical protein J6590_030435 [Homalodisca vitripennis]